MRELKREDMGADTESLQLMRWEKFAVYQELLEDISSKLEFMWFFPYGTLHEDGYYTEERNGGIK